MVSFAPNRRLSTGATVEGHVTVVNLTEQNLMQQNARPANVHPFINNFTSPIGMFYFFISFHSFDSSKKQTLTDAICFVPSLPFHHSASPSVSGVE